MNESQFPRSAALQMQRSGKDGLILYLNYQHLRFILLIKVDYLLYL